MLSNLPPGVTDSMLPGNRPEDIAWDNFYEMLSDEAGDHLMSSEDCFVAWKLGLASYLRLRSLGIKLPHDGEDVWEALGQAVAEARKFANRWRIPIEVIHGKHVVEFVWPA